MCNVNELERKQLCKKMLRNIKTYSCWHVLFYIDKVHLKGLVNIVHDFKKKSGVDFKVRSSMFTWTWIIPGWWVSYNSRDLLFQPIATLIWHLSCQRRRRGWIAGIPRLILPLHPPHPKRIFNLMSEQSCFIDQANSFELMKDYSL